MNDPVKTSINRVVARWLRSMGLTESQIARMLNVNMEAVRYRLDEDSDQRDQDAPVSGLQLEMLRRLCLSHKRPDSLEVEDVRRLNLPIKLKPQKESEATEAIHVMRHASKEQLDRLQMSAKIILKGEQYMMQIVESLNLPMERVVTLAMKDCMKDQKLKALIEVDLHGPAEKKPRHAVC